MPSSWRSRPRRPRSPASRCRTSSTSTRCFEYRAARGSRTTSSTAAAATIDELLPGDEPLADRLAALGRPVRGRDRSPAGASSTGWSAGSVTRPPTTFGLPDGEDLRVSLVSGQPWTAYNWYDGGRRSRIDVNTDLPARAADLIGTGRPRGVSRATTSSMPGRRPSLVDGPGRLEASILLINTPECLISEGLADLGVRFAAPPDGAGRTCWSSCTSAPACRRRRSGRVARGRRADACRSPSRARALAADSAATPRSCATPTGAPTTRSSTTSATVGRYPPDVAAKRLEFIEHPLWRTYVFVYAEGEALLARWLDAVPERRAAGRFGRLLREQLTPAAVTAPG